MIKLFVEHQVLNFSWFFERTQPRENDLLNGLCDIQWMFQRQPFQHLKKKEKWRWAKFNKAHDNILQLIRVV